MRVVRYVLFATTLWAAGCATTPQARIKANPQLFAHLPQSEQVLVRTGRIRRGFGMDAVRLALGSPNRVITATGPYGPTQTWFYFGYVSVPDGSSADWRSSDDRPAFRGRFSLPNSSWGGGGSPQAEPIQNLVSVPYNKVVVEFRDGKAVRVTGYVSPTAYK